MARVLLLSFLCFAVALMGITGVHAHVPAAESPVVQGEHVHHGAYLVSIVDTDHQADHDDDGDLDIEPLIKAFGKSTLSAVIAIVAILATVVVLLLPRFPTLYVLVPPPLRPPKPAQRFFLLPPSHAPPTSLR